VHPQTLRSYEREVLLDPARSAGATRRYPRREIDRLAGICALTAGRLNLAGIRRVLQLQGKPASCKPNWPSSENRPVLAGTSGPERRIRKIQTPDT
jgi:DNA-binding transcriptional MerR regulator